MKKNIKNLINAIIRSLFAIKRPSKRTNERRLRDRKETINSFTIREATIADIPALSILHAKAWSETYWNVKNLPTAELREYQWRNSLK